MAHRD